METRMALLEQNCEKCPEAFRDLKRLHSDLVKCITDKFDKLTNEILNLKLENARSKGFRAAIFGAGGGGLAIVAAKVASMIFSANPK